MPHARRHVDEDNEEANLANDEQGKPPSLEEIMNPFLDKDEAVFGAVIMAATLVAVLALNAASTESGAHPAFWVTLPAAYIMFCWDLVFGWCHPEETHQIFRSDRQVENAKAELAIRQEEIRCDRGPPTLVSLGRRCIRMVAGDVSTATAAVVHLPFVLVPFSLSMFVLVQALVTKD